MKTTTNTMNWRERQALKETQQREAARKAADEVERKRYANTHENFPTLVTTAHRMNTDALQGFADLANKMRLHDEVEQQLEAYRKAKSVRERRHILNTVVLLRRPQQRYDEEDEEEVPEDTPQDLRETYPPHGTRGTYSDVYWDPEHGDGWRMVTKKMRKVKRELTEAELAQKYREEFLMDDDGSEHYESNANYPEDSRRAFY